MDKEQQNDHEITTLNMFKTGDRLSKEELDKLELCFLQYYRKRYARFREYGIRNMTDKGLSGLFLKRYAKREIERIMTGESIAVVKYSGDVPLGFMTGSIDGWLEGKLASYFIACEDREEANKILWDLYSVFVKEMRKRGAKSLVAEIDIRDNLFIDTLERLEFVQLDWSNETAKYGKKIM